MHADQVDIETHEPLPQRIPLRLRFNDVFDHQIVSRERQRGQAIEEAFKDLRTHRCPIERAILELLPGQNGRVEKEKIERKLQKRLIDLRLNRPAKRGFPGARGTVQEDDFSRFDGGHSQILRLEPVACYRQNYRTISKTTPMIAATTPPAIAHGTQAGVGKLTPLGSMTIVFVVSSPGSFAFEVMSEPSTGNR